MAIVKGQYNQNTGSYVSVDTTAKAWSLKAASIPQFRNGEGTTVFTESDIENLNRGVFENNSLTDSQISDFFGVQPIDTLEAYRTEGLNLYLQTLDNGQKEVLLSDGGSAVKGLLNTETAADLLASTNFGVDGEGVIGQQSVNSFAVTSGSQTRGAVGGAPTDTVLKYPIDMDLNIQDHMVITAATRVQAALPSIDTLTDTGQFVRTRNNQLHETIIFPMPNAISSTDAVNFGSGESMGSVAGGIVGEGLNQILNAKIEGENIGDSLNNLGQAILTAGGGALKGIGDAAGAGYVKRKLLLQGAAAAAGVIGVNVDVGQVVSRLAGAVENPNLELLFQGPGLRDFGFDIRFTPRSQEEAIRVRQIIRTLKRRMSVKRNATSFLGQGGSNLLLGTPDVFRLEYRRGSTTQEEIKGLNKFKTCVLDSLNVDYSGGSGRWAAYGADSQPVTTIITMRFREIVPVYEDDYTNSGFADDDVGF